MASWIEKHSGLGAFARPAPEVLAACGTYATATLHEAAGRRGALPSAIKPVAVGMAFCGPAFTIQSPPGDNLWFHRALALARPGDVLVAEVGGLHEAGYWGDVMTNAAIARGLSALVVDGCVRDGEALARLGFPVFARGLCIRGTGKSPGARGGLAVPLRIGEELVRPGDILVGDGDGVVVLDPAEAESIVEKASAREEKERAIIAALAKGRTTLDLLDLD